MPWPRACCARDGLLQVGELLGWEQCQERSPGYIHEQVRHNSAVSVPVPASALPRLMEHSIRDRSLGHCLLCFHSPVTPKVLSSSCPTGEPP